MIKPRFSKKQALFFTFSMFLVSLVFVASLTKASLPSNPLFPNSDVLLYTSSNGQDSSINSIGLLPQGFKSDFDFGNNIYTNQKNEIYLSPNRKLIAITLDPVGTEGGSYTYIIDVDGVQITQPAYGSFDAWMPDSSAVLLYVSPMEEPWIRNIYTLDTKGTYIDFGLPQGTISADVSPIDGSIVYSLTDSGSDNSTLYIQDQKGNTSTLLKGENNIFAWVRWSPIGNQIAFMQSNLAATDTSQQFVFIINSDGAGLSKISNVNWNYPVVWSPDGLKIAFGNGENIFEYDTTQKLFIETTNFLGGTAQYPSYSADGKTIVFSAGLMGQSKIWSMQNEEILQLTNDTNQDEYPILP